MTVLAAEASRYLELTLTPRREYVSPQEQLRRRVTALENRHEVIARTVASLPDGTPPAEIAQLIRKLAGIN